MMNAMSAGHTLSNHVPRRTRHHRQRSKEGGTRHSGKHGILSIEREGAQGYEASATYMTTHHDHEIRFKELHI